LVQFTVSYVAELKFYLLSLFTRTYEKTQAEVLGFPKDGQPLVSTALSICDHGRRSEFAKI